MLRRIVEQDLVDYLAMDVKNSPEKYALTVGLEKIDLGKINESIDLLKTCGVDHEFRTTVIKEFHTDEDMRAIAEWVKGAKRYVMQKYKDSEGCISHGYTPLEKDGVQRFATYFDGLVEKVDLRGYN